MPSTSLSPSGGETHTAGHDARQREIARLGREEQRHFDEADALTKRAKEAELRGYSAQRQAGLVSDEMQFQARVAPLIQAAAPIAGLVFHYTGPADDLISVSVGELRSLAAAVRLTLGESP